jgi:D-inositol-3-phosphate glycosyltransferase
MKQKKVSDPASEPDVALLTGGIDKHYSLGLSLALGSKGVNLDMIGNTEMDSPEIHRIPTLTFLNLYGNARQKSSLGRKLLRHLAVYGRLIRYASTATPRVFHILWNYKFQFFDRIFLLLYYKALGKKIVFTAHNVNAAERDGSDSLLNRLSLKIQYRLVDHIFVHTEKMKDQVTNDFGVGIDKISIIPFGLNNAVPQTCLTPMEARQRMRVRDSDKVILFFGRILPYKGLSYLVEAFQRIAFKDDSYRLVIAGEPKKESMQYWRDIQQTIEREIPVGQVIQDIKFIRDEEVEVYFKSADVLVLPYTDIFQSGVLFLAYSFGLPVIATDVGSLRNDIIEHETGYICRPRDTVDLARTIETYFQSNLFKTLDQRRTEIRAFAQARNCWDVVSADTRNVYLQLLARDNFGNWRPAA